MFTIKTRSEAIQPSLLVALLTLTAFLAPFVLRSWDNNRLTSWQWVFADTNILEALLILVLAISCAYILSGISYSRRSPAGLLFIASFGITMMFWSEPEVIVDASRYFIQAKHLALYGIGYWFREWGGEISAWTDLPLVPFIYGLIFDIFGETRAGAQVLSSLLFSATVVLTYLIGKLLWNKTLGLYAGMFLLGMPYLFTQVPLLLVDIPTMFFLTLAVFTTIKVVRHGGVGWQIATAVAIWLALLSKYSTWLMLSVIPVIILCHWKSGWWTLIRRTGAPLLGAALLMGVVVLLKFEVFATQIKLLHSFQVPGLQRWQESFISTFFFQIHPFITIAALYASYVAWRKKDSRFAIIGWMLLLVMLFGIKRSRYIILVLPMLALMAAYGLSTIKDRKLNRFIIWCTLLSALMVALWGYLPFLRNISAANLAEAGGYINSIDTAHHRGVGKVEVFVLPQVRSSINPAISVSLLDIYTKADIIYHYDMRLMRQPKSIKNSSLRFTWEYSNPRYFTAGANGIDRDSVIVIIAAYNNQTLPKNLRRRIATYRLSKELMVLDKVFRYQTIVRVYQPV